MALAQRKILVNVGFYSEFPKKLAEAKDIVSEGAVGFKLFMGSQIGGLNIDDDQVLRMHSKKLRLLNVPVAVHAEDKALLTKNEDKLKQAKKNSIAAFQSAHSEAVEAKSHRTPTKNK